MLRFLIRRIIGAIAVLFAISVLVFLIFNVVPATNPAQRIAGKNATPQLIKNVEEEWGFDKALPAQYWTQMKLIFTGKVESFQSHINVDERILEGIPATASLCIGAAVIWLAFGFLFGYLSAVRSGGWLDRGLTVLALVGISMPVFWLASILLYYFTYKIEIFPASGYKSLSNPGEWASHLILPWISLAVLFAGFYSRVLRSSMLDVMNEDYVRTARAKGLSQRRVMTRHVLRNSLIPVITLFGLDFGVLIGGGAIVTESLFNIEGVGLFTAEALQTAGLPLDHGGHPLRRLLHRPLQHPGRHRLRLPGSADPPGCLGRMSATPETAPVSPGVGGGPLLEVDGLRVGFATEDGRVQAVDGVDFQLEPGEVLAIVGESGSGKSVTAQTLIGLTRSPNSHIEGSVRLRGEELDLALRIAAAAGARLGRSR